MAIHLSLTRGNIVRKGLYRDNGRENHYFVGFRAGGVIVFLNFHWGQRDLQFGSQSPIYAQSTIFKGC